MVDGGEPYLGTQFLMLALSLHLILVRIFNLIEFQLLKSMKFGMRDFLVPFSPLVNFS